MQAGCFFLYCMTDLQHSTPQSLHRRIHRALVRPAMVVHVRMSLERYIIPLKSLLVVEIATDESGTWGCPRPLVSGPVGLKVTQPPHCRERADPNYLSMVWGNSWWGLQVHCHCDNQVVVACLQSRTSKKQEHYAHASLHGLY